MAAAPVVSALRQDYMAGLIAGAPSCAAALLIFFLVICPAVWSKDQGRQSAALAVLDRLLGRPVAPHTQRKVRRKVTSNARD